MDYKIEDKEKRLEIVNQIIKDPVVQKFYEEYGESKTNAFSEIISDYLCGGAMKDRPYVGGSRQVEKIDSIIKKADECQVIKDYADYREYLRWLKKQPESENQKVVIDSIMGTVNDDIKTANDAFYPKVQSGGEPSSYYETDYSCVDYTDLKQVRIIVMMPKYDALHPCYYIKEDIMNIIRNHRSIFSRRELQIAESFYVYGGRNVSAVAEMYNIPRSSVSYYVKAVAKKIVSIELSLSKQYES